MRDGPCLGGGNWLGLRLVSSVQIYVLLPQWSRFEYQLDRRKIARRMTGSEIYKFFLSSKTGI